jgi:hypothetical protein
MAIDKDDVITLMNAFHEVSMIEKGTRRRAGCVLPAPGRGARLRPPR